MRGVAALGLALAAALTIAQSGLAQQRTIKPEAPGGQTAGGFYTNSWALVVGINKYQQAPGLNYAVADAKAVAEALPPLGFPRQNIRLLLDGEATKARIETVLYEDFVAMGLQDRLFVFFAGHGETAQIKGGEEGYLLPVDANPRSLARTAIPMDDVKRIGQRVKAKHVLFVMDACFSGFAATRDIAPTGVTDEYLAAALRESVVQVLTAGRKGERAIEEGGHGLFTKRLLDALRGATPEGRGILTAAQLAAWIEPRVVRDSKGKMTPQYGRLDGEGQFVFVIGQTAGARISAIDLETAKRQAEERRRQEEEARAAEQARQLAEEQNRIAEAQSRLKEEKEHLEADKQRLEEEKRRLAALPKDSAPTPPVVAPFSPGGVVKIATQSPLTGGQAPLGEAIKLGAQLALENLKGNLEQQGVRIELVAFDDQARPDVGVANAKNIIADKDIVVVIGHLNSGVAIPSSDVYKEANLAMISPANTNPTVTDRGYQNVYRIVGRDDLQGAAGAEFAASTLRAKSAYVIHDRTTYGQGVATAFRAYAERKGIQIVGWVGTQEKVNFETIIADIRAKTPDVVYFGGIYDQAGPLMKQARDRGVKAEFLGPDGLDSADFAALAGRAAEGTYYTSVAGPVSVYPLARQFAEAFKRRFGKRPEPFAAQAYDATATAIKAIEDLIRQGRSPSRNQVTAAIRQVRYQGITGPIEFNAKGDSKTSLYFVLRVASSNPSRWGDNREVKRVTFTAP